MTEVWQVSSREDWERRVSLREAVVSQYADTEVNSDITVNTSPEVDVLTPTRKFAVQALEQGLKVTALFAISGELRSGANGDDIEVGEEHIVIRGGVRRDPDRNAPHYHVTVSDYQENIYPNWTEAKLVRVKSVPRKRVSQKGSF